MTMPNEDAPVLLANHLAQHAKPEMDPGAGRTYTSHDTIVGHQVAASSPLGGAKYNPTNDQRFTQRTGSQPTFDTGATPKQYAGESGLEDSGLHPGANRARKVDPNVQKRIDQFFQMSDSDELPPF